MKTKKYKSKDKPEGFDACYAKLKAEADTKFARERKTKTVKRETPAKHDIPEGYMSLQQFEKELVEAVNCHKKNLPRWWARPKRRYRTG